jgi:CoA:oxalate CoA-transferase
MLELGASVVKVEPPRGDPARYLAPGGYAVLNGEKEILSLDLKSPPGAERAWQLIADADVVVEGFRPGVMARLGFGPDEVLARHLGVVYVSISGYGQEGPLFDNPGHDINNQAASGVLSLAGAAGSGPAHALGVPIGDFCGSAYALSATLAGLLVSRSSGRGQHIDVSVTDALLHWMNSSLAHFQYKGLHDLDAQRRFVLSKPAYDVFATRDGAHIAVGAMEDHFWQRLAKALKFNEELTGLYFDERSARVEEVNASITAALLHLDLREALDLFDAADVPANQVVTANNLPDSAHARARGFLTRTGEYVHSRYPVRINGAPDAVQEAECDAAHQSAQQRGQPAARSESGPIAGTQRKDATDESRRYTHGF